MNYLDTGVLISAIYLRDSKQEKCSSLLEDGVTSTHALAEAFAALTGQYRVKSEIVSEALLSLRDQLRIETIPPEDYFSIIAEAKARGVMGGLVYDAIHATVARRLKVDRLYTFNVSNFEHVAPDLKILAP
jgi:predicted nucleic acid-binding protein